MSIILTLKTLIRLKVFFPLWKKLHKLSLYGMNIGPGGGVDQSGERWVMKHIARRLKGQGTIFDVGANKGDYASALLDEFGSQAAVYCFEPSKHTCASLKDRFKGQDNIQVFNFGFGDEESTLSLYSDKEGSTLASLYPRDLNHVGIDMGAVETVELKTVDGFCAEQKIEHIDLLKLDVEGHELNALRGASSLIGSGSVDFIQFEFGGCNIDSKTYFKDFFLALKPNYKIYRILRNGIFPVTEYSEYLETFLTANFLAISRRLDEQ